MEIKRGWMVGMAVILMLVWNSPVFAFYGKSNQATLRDIPGIGVLVEQLAPEVEREGITRDQLQRDVETKLRAEGIKVLTKEECSKTLGEPYLYININVNTAKTESDIYPYTIDVMLIQRVLLVRDPTKTPFAVTWSRGGIGSITKEMLNQLRGSVEEAVEMFIKAYRAENPK